MYRVQLNIVSEEFDSTDIMGGEIVADLDEFMTMCQTLWVKMQRVVGHRRDGETVPTNQEEEE